jgi:DNA-binding transcriptional LysR family regulator
VARYVILAESTDPQLSKRRVETPWLDRKGPGASPPDSANDPASQVAAARAGVRIAVLPRFLADQEPGLVALSADLKGVARDIRLSSRRVVAALVFVAMLHEKIEVGRRRLLRHPEQRVFGACHNLPMELC